MIFKRKFQLVQLTWTTKHFILKKVMVLFMQCSPTSNFCDADGAEVSFSGTVTGGPRNLLQYPILVRESRFLTGLQKHHPHEQTAIVGNVDPLLFQWLDQ